jgi:hypothetical protein
MHPFQAFLRRRKLPQQWAVDEAKAIGVSLSQSTLSDLFNRKLEARVALLSLLERISERKVTAVAMTRWHLENPVLVGTPAPASTSAPAADDPAATERAS